MSKKAARLACFFVDGYFPTYAAKSLSTGHLLSSTGVFSRKNSVNIVFEKKLCVVCSDILSFYVVCFFKKLSWGIGIYKKSLPRPEESYWISSIFWDFKIEREFFVGVWSIFFIQDFRLHLIDP
jgi:hypothetical protein